MVNWSSEDKADDERYHMDERICNRIAKLKAGAGIIGMVVAGLCERDPNRDHPDPQSYVNT